MGHVICLVNENDISWTMSYSASRLYGRIVVLQFYLVRKNDFFSILSSVLIFFVCPVSDTSSFLPTLTVEVLLADNSNAHAT